MLMIITQSCPSESPRSGASPKSHLRAEKPSRDRFMVLPRNRITVVLDGVTGSYNQGALFRLCDAFLVEKLVVCAAMIDLRQRRLIQAARGAQHWVPWELSADAATAVRQLKTAKYTVVAAELCPSSEPVETIIAHSPMALVLGGERHGVSAGVLELADQIVAIPMAGMSNSLNVAMTGAILPHAIATKGNFILDDKSGGQKRCD
jgi:tRNA G18 (ribose-2'-O)-methylase SpoU